LVKYLRYVVVVPFLPLILIGAIGGACSYFLMESAMLVMNRLEGRR